GGAARAGVAVSATLEEDVRGLGYRKSDANLGLNARRITPRHLQRVARRIVSFDVQCAAASGRIVGKRETIPALARVGDRVNPLSGGVLESLGELIWFARARGEAHGGEGVAVVE